jgi:hypothetical protein
VKSMVENVSMDCDGLIVMEEETDVANGTESVSLDIDGLSLMQEESGISGAEEEQ